MHRSTLAIPLVLAAAFGCSDRILDDDRAVDTDAPTIIIEKPERGTILPDSQVEVQGRVEDNDSEVTGLEINGNQVTLRPDGSFETLIQVGDGITLIRTVATDVDGNEGTDTRSVMAGNLVPQDTPAFDGAAGRMGRETFENVNLTTENLLESPDEIAKMAEKFNPIVDAGGNCLGVQLELESVTMDDADVNILPVEGGIAFDIVLQDIEVRMPSDFAVACIDGSATVVATADQATLTGRINIGLDRGALVVELVDVDSTFLDIDVDVGFLKSEIIEAFLWDLEGLAGKAVENIIHSQVNKFIDNFLTDFVKNEWSVIVSDTELVFGATPTMVEFNDNGGFIAVDTKVVATSPQTDLLGYVSTPSDAPALEMRDYPGFRAIIADDFVNQAFAAFWSTGALEKAVAFDSEVADKESFLGNAIDRVEITALLPPYVDARDQNALSITLGDILVDIINETPTGDDIVTRLALSGQVTLSVDIDS
ncbi:MAG: hypothetical protein KJO07_10605, partial [Deltaproteobacteria bacterium]|nr:hypothetical protein [Deltaproteobacteria bacterium]